MIVAQIPAASSHIPYACEGALAVSLGAIIWVLKYLLTTYAPEQQKQFTATLDNLLVRDEKRYNDRLEETTKLREAIDGLAKTCLDHQRKETRPES